MARSFLRQIAQYYLNQIDPRHLKDITFVFPNRRSGQFFERELHEHAKGPLVLPRVTTFIEWMGDITQVVPVTSIESVFLLYRAYKQEMGDNADDMEHFVHWASIIVNDFNDVDRSLVDARDLYTNIGNLRDLRTDYLEDDLKELIRRIFGIDLRLAKEEADRFWMHHDKNNNSQPNTPGDEVRRRFYSLWDALPTIYKNFHDELSRRGLTSPGMMVQRAIHTVNDLPAHQEGEAPMVVMVGFADLAAGELKIFDLLRNKHLAHFWWDNASPQGKIGGPWWDLINELAQRYPMPEALDVIDTQPTLRQVAVAGNMAQAKRAFHEIDLMVDDGRIANSNNAIGTAIVLPDEALLMPLINSTSLNVTHLNVTLGIPLHRSSIVSLMRIVARAHHRADWRNDQCCFFRDDVNDVLSHPLVKSTQGAQAMRLHTHIAQKNIFMVPQSLIAEKAPQLTPLFTPVGKQVTLQDVLAYIDNLKEFVLDINDRKLQHIERDPDDNTLPLQCAFMQQYVNALQQLRHVLERCADIFTSLGDEAIFFLIDRITSSEVIPFTGEPLLGLQLMGVLETQCLDFDNMVMLSMNDRTYPSRHSLSTFIPNYMRADKLMPTIAHADAVAAYYFYRGIARAKHITFIYNSSTSGLSSNEPSRYIEQLRRVYGLKIAKEQVQVPLVPTQDITVEVNTGTVAMERFGPDAQPEQAKWLSASSINTYINCPLRFYFQYIHDLPGDNAPSDFMDRPQFGTIVHNTLEKLYGTKGGRRITAAMIEQFKHKALQEEAIAQINEVYCRRPASTPLTGEALLMLSTVETFVRRVLDYDIELLKDSPDNYFLMETCEEREELPSFDMNGTKVRFTFKADRIDRIVINDVPGPLRIIDYKTGRDETTFTSIEQLFDGDSEKRPKAVLQLLLYCAAYRARHNYDDIIEPHIYKIREMKESGVLLKKDTQVVCGDPDFADLEKQFAEHMGQTLNTLLSPDGRWTQCSINAKHCKNCNFTAFCQR